MRHFIVPGYYVRKAAMQRLFHIFTIFAILASNFGALVMPVQAKASAGVSSIASPAEPRAQRLNEKHPAPALTHPDGEVEAGVNKADQSEEDYPYHKNSLCLLVEPDNCDDPANWSSYRQYTVDSDLEQAGLDKEVRVICLDKAELDETIGSNGCTQRYPVYYHYKTTA